MIAVDACAVLGAWHAAHAHTLARASIVATFKSTDHGEKAMIALEGPSHVASITLWGSGMVEFIVLDVRTSETVITQDVEHDSVSSIVAGLDGCLDTMLRLLAG